MDGHSIKLFGVILAINNLVMSWGYSSSLLVGLDWGEKEAIEVFDILLGWDCKHVA